MWRRFARHPVQPWWRASIPSTLVCSTPFCMRLNRADCLWPNEFCPNIWKIWATRIIVSANGISGTIRRSIRRCIGVSIAMWATGPDTTITLIIPHSSIKHGASTFGATWMWLTICTVNTPRTWSRMNRCAEFDSTIARFRCFCTFRMRPFIRETPTIRCRHPTTLWPNSQILRIFRAGNMQVQIDGRWLRPLCVQRRSLNSFFSFSL